MADDRIILELAFDRLWLDTTCQARRCVGADGLGCAQQMAVRSGTCLWHTRSRASSAPLYPDRGYSCSAHLAGNGNAHFNHHAAGQPLKRNIS